MRNPDIPTHTIGSLGELIEFAERLDSDSVPSHWFRGQADERWSVQCALWRRTPDTENGNGGLAYSHDDERNLAHRFRVRAANRRVAAPEYSDAAAWLSLMQHYGLPTRLLDWSRSPLVAAYFAVSRVTNTSTEATDRDAAIWVLDPHALNFLRCRTDLTPGLSSRQVAHLVNHAFYDPSLSHMAHSPRRETEGHVMAAMAWETDIRMVMQQGAFTVHGAPCTDDDHNGLAGIDEEEDSSEYLHLLLIPAGVIRQMRSQLFAAGLREGDLFPDLEHLAHELVETYPPGALKPR